MNDPDRSENYRTCGVIHIVSKRGQVHSVYGLIYKRAKRGTPNKVKWKNNREVNLSF